jgi:hypothetical protein
MLATASAAAKMIERDMVGSWGLARQRRVDGSFVRAILDAGCDRGHTEYVAYGGDSAVEADGRVWR